MKIAIGAIRATKLHPFAVTSFIERTPKDEVSRSKIMNTAIACTECPKMSGSMSKRCKYCLVCMKYDRNSKLLNFYIDI